MIHYKLRQIMIERYPCNDTTLDNGKAHRIRSVHVNPVGEFNSEESLAVGDIIALDDGNWVVTRKILKVSRYGFQDFILDVKPYYDTSTFMIFNRTVVEDIPLFPEEEKK